MPTLKNPLLRNTPLRGGNPLAGRGPLRAASLPAVSLPAVSLPTAGLPAAGLLMTLMLAGCASQPSVPMPETTAGSIPSVLLRSSQMASRAQQRVSEVLFVQTHPPVVAIAPSHWKAMGDRFHFHWEGPVNVVALNLAAAMGWSMEFAKPQPSFMPSVYIDQNNSNVRQMLDAINRQIMPTAILRAQPKGRKLILQVPTQAEIRHAILKGYFPTPARWFQPANRVEK
ncbi:MAG: DotD/TraH family lipoprotein [Acidithiobacillus sp.]|nr:DotD/TraH family lipoprotein [Acidithiobacillus sp.]